MSLFNSGTRLMFPSGSGKSQGFDEAHSLIPGYVQLLGSWFDQDTGVAPEP